MFATVHYINCNLNTAVVRTKCSAGSRTSLAASQKYPMSRSSTKIDNSADHNLPVRTNCSRLYLIIFVEFNLADVDKKGTMN